MVVTVAMIVRMVVFMDVVVAMLVSMLVGGRLLLAHGRALKNVIVGVVMHVIVAMIVIMIMVMVVVVRGLLGLAPGKYCPPDLAYISKWMALPAGAQRHGSFAHNNPPKGCLEGGTIPPFQQHNQGSVYSDYRVKASGNFF